MSKEGLSVTGSEDDNGDKGCFMLVFYKFHMITLWFHVIESLRIMRRVKRIVRVHHVHV